jgi:hypothetical protein
MDSVFTTAEDGAVADPGSFTGSVSGYVTRGYPRVSAGNSPRGGVSRPTSVLLTLSSGQMSVSGEPQSPPSRGNDISMASEEPRALVVVSQAVSMDGSYQANGTYSHSTGFEPIIPTELNMA